MRALSEGALLVVVEDADAARRVHHVAALAGVPSTAAPDPLTPATWSRAAGVVVAAARLPRLEALPRRSRVVVLAEPDRPPELWAHALRLGAEAVLSLPADEQPLLEWMLLLTAPAASGSVLCCLGARGGVGASTLAAALALTAAAARRSLVVDADAAAGGLDLLLGIEDVEGKRWPAFAEARGLLPPDALASLPRAGRASVLSCAAGDQRQPAEESVRAIVDTARRVYDVVVLDAGRHRPLPVPAPAVAVVVVPCEVRAVAAAAGLTAALRADGHDVRLVVRTPGPGDLRPRHVADATGVPVVAGWRWQRRLDGLIDEGRFVRSCARSSAGKAARSVLAAVGAA